MLVTEWPMKTRRHLVAVMLAALLLALAFTTTASAQKVLTGSAAFGDWRADEPGLRRLITPRDLPQPYATRSASNFGTIARRPAGSPLKVPPGFAVRLFADGLDEPRIVHVAPNGDIFVAESAAGRIRVLRPSDSNDAPKQTETFASGLRYPFGIAFYPSGPDPEWVYVANTDQVVRFAYRPGDLRARGKPETIANIPGGGGHRTRDIAFSADGSRMFVSVGSSSNDAEGMPRMDTEGVRRHEAEHGLGAMWAGETDRADVLVFDPQGKSRRVFATGLRNCVGLAVQPGSGDVWCSTNERDALGDDLPPDYITRVRDGGFYGWPWYYIGDNEDPRHKGERPDLRGKTMVPDVLIQAHSASLGMTFYQGSQFPADYQGSAFAAEHGSWNRSKRTGYKVIRVILRDGAPTGEYEDFVTGFVTGNSSIWGRPVGVATARDGSLLISEDGNGTIWRVTFEGKPAGK
jgi:glucose/arabinose dehydrogenase